MLVALVGAKLSAVLHVELTIPVQRSILWSDSSTVLNWLTSNSCHFKVFVGTRVAEIQELTRGQEWHANNPADDITRGKTLSELIRPNRWSQGPPFLLKLPDFWPTRSLMEPSGDHGELRKPHF